MKNYKRAEILNMSQLLFDLDTERTCISVTMTIKAYRNSPCQDFVEAYVVDFQGFKTYNNTFIIKELVIVSVRTDCIVHCMVKSPRVRTQGIEKQVNYLTRRFHKIRWEDGYVEFNDALKLLRETLTNADIVYVKGLERTKYIRKLLENKITVQDLDPIGCPKAKNWHGCSLSRFPVCPYKNHKNLPEQARDTDVHCALKKALTYKDWYNCFA